MQEASGAQTGHLPTYMRANIQTDRAADLGSNLEEGQREERQRQPCCVTLTRKEVSHMVDKQPHPRGRAALERREKPRMPGKVHLGSGASIRKNRQTNHEEKYPSESW